jgi:hypothetical protein
MNILTRAIRRRVMDRIDAALDVARPAPRTVGGALLSRLAAASVLRLALRWPALSVLLIVSVVAARFMARRPGGIIVRAPAQPQLGKASGPGDQPASL